MIAQNCIFFYILSFFLIATGILIIMMPKLSRAIAVSVFFFLGISVLYFAFKSMFLVLFQIFISAAATTSLLITGYNATKNVAEKKYTFPAVKFTSGLFVFVSVLIIIGLFVYYFSNISTGSDILIFNDKNNFSFIINLLVTAKTVFIDYILAFGLVTALFTAVIIGVSILIAKEKQIKNNKGENDNVTD